jgi:hypothetical protein
MPQQRYRRAPLLTVYPHFRGETCHAPCHLPQGVLLEPTFRERFLVGGWVNKGKRAGREDARNARPCRAFFTPLQYHGLSGPLLSVSGHMYWREEGKKRCISQPQRRRWSGSSP